MVTVAGGGPRQNNNPEEKLATAPDSAAAAESESERILLAQADRRGRNNNRRGNNNDAEADRGSRNRSDAAPAAPAPEPQMIPPPVLRDKTIDPHGHQQDVQAEALKRPDALEKLGLQIKNDSKWQDKFKISAEKILSFAGTDGRIDYVAIGREALTNGSFVIDGKPGEMTTLVANTLPTTPTPASAPVAVPAPVAVNTVMPEPEQKGAWQQFKDDVKALPGEIRATAAEAKAQIREDFTGTPRQAQAGNIPVEQGHESSGTAPGGEGGQQERPGFFRRLGNGAKTVVGVVAEEALGAVLPNINLGRGHGGLDMMHLAEVALNPQERASANALLRNATVMIGGKALGINPEGVSMQVLNKVFDIPIPQDGKQLTAADLKGLTAEEQTLILHRQNVGKQIESSREISDAEWNAATAREYALPPDMQQRMTTLEEYTRQLQGQGGGQQPAPQAQGGGQQPQGGTPRQNTGSPAAEGQFVAYVAGNKVSADLAVSRTLRDRHGDPVIMNSDALARFEGVIDSLAAQGLETGKGYIITSSFRTDAEQRFLYSKYLKGENPYPVAQPGYSKHQSGFALDIAVSANATPEQVQKFHAAMKEAGFVRPIPNSDPVHWVYVGPVSSGKNPVLA